MPKMTLIAAILILTATAHASAPFSVKVVGAKADALVKAYVDLGHDSIGTHTYFQSGVTACAEMFDEDGDHFGAGSEGQYIGEACMVYGDAYDSEDTDADGVQRAYALIPPDDRDLAKNPKLKAKLEKLKALRLALEDLVAPLVRKETVNGREVIATRTSGIAGIACEGYTASGQRTCQVLPSHLCPIRR